MWENCDPEAVLSRNVRDFGFPIYDDTDSLDDYEAVELEIDGFLFSIRTYAGFPPGNCSIYFPILPAGPGKRSPETAAYLLGRIFAELGLTQADVMWQRFNGL